VIVTCGASGPDAILDEVLRRVLSFVEAPRSLDDVMAPYPANVS
jgi:hypothetical protein